MSHLSPRSAPLSRASSNITPVLVPNTPLADLEPLLTAHGGHWALSRDGKGLERSVKFGTFRRMRVGFSLFLCGEVGGGEWKGKGDVGRGFWEGGILGREGLRMRADLWGLVGFHRGGTQLTRVAAQVYNKAFIRLTTHRDKESGESGISTKDLDFARFCDEAIGDDDVSADAAADGSWGEELTAHVSEAGYMPEMAEAVDDGKQDVVGAWEGGR
ncbi:hypothetical protein MMC17_002432 [Xylographa soralifera]|nr:hypothetical protein [Xylographa soralifera]